MRAALLVLLVVGSVRADSDPPVELHPGAGSWILLPGLLIPIAAVVALVLALVVKPRAR
jgi:hypothetical protein